jgi:glycosyltransferase involved in cell wall biosynthesis
LVDGRIDARDGIGRYTRCTVRALQRAATPDIEVHVLRPSAVVRYSAAEDAELVESACAIRAHVVHALNYRVPIEGLRARLVATVHDSAHLIAPDLCFTDEEFGRYFGEATLSRLRLSVRSIEGGADRSALRLPYHARYFRAMLRHTLTTASAVVVPTRSLAGELREFVPGARLTATAWGADHLPAVPGRLPCEIGRAPFVLFVSVARRYKGIGELAAGYARSHARCGGARLVLAGDRCGPSGPAAEMLNAAGVDDAVLLGDVDDRTLTALYRAAAVLVHPARFESFGFAPVEALTQGCAVAANDIPALREVLGGHADLVDVGDSAALAAAIDNAVFAAGTDSKSQGAGTRDTRIRFASRYRWRQHAMDLLDLYRHVAT